MLHYPESKLLAARSDADDAWTAPDNFVLGIMSPATRQHDARTLARSGLVRPERVAYDHAVVVADQLDERRRALVVADAVIDRLLRAQAPHLPGLTALVVEPLPAGLVEPDHALCHQVLVERRVMRDELCAERVHEIPQRL